MQQSNEPWIRREIPQPLGDLLRYLEHHCMYYCCGFESYELGYEHCALWTKAAGAAPAKLALEQLRDLRKVVAGLETFRLEFAHNINSLNEKEFWELMDRTEENLQRAVRLLQAS